MPNTVYLFDALGMITSNIPSFDPVLSHQLSTVPRVEDIDIQKRVSYV